MRSIIALFLFLYSVTTMAQDGSQQVQRHQNNPNQQNDTESRDVLLEGEKPPITDYKIMTVERDTTHLDTTLTIHKNYKFNYLRRDDFGLLPFSNVGQTYNSLTYDFDEVRLRPQFGARARHFNFMEIDDINYYHVPTPLTELYFKTAFEQGQQLDAFFTVNTSEQFNFSLAYKGLRSLGTYQNTLTSTGNFRFTANYTTKNKRYNLRAHVVFQDLMNQENGGVKDDFIQYFVNDVSDFQDRGRLEVNFQDANNMLEGRRFFIQHEYALIQQVDSTSRNTLKIGNKAYFENKYYHYGQDAPYREYGPSYGTANLRDKTKLEDAYAQLYADYSNDVLGDFRVFAGYNSFNYGYNTVLYLDDETITNRLTGTVIEAGAAYRKYYRGFELLGKAAINVSGDFEGNYILGQASYELNEHNRAKAKIHVSSVAPNYNFMLYQSDYVNYNWQTAFKNIKKQHLQFDLESDKLFNAHVSYTGIDDYTYFAIDETTNTPKPNQYNGRVNYLKVEAQREVQFGKFGAEARLLYQNVLSGQDVFNVPELLGRGSIYFNDRFFKNALYLQTGFTGTYFTEYYMNAYDPVLAEFYIQNEQKLGAFPLVDFFVNAKISQTRIFFKLEHFNSLFGEKNYFSAPNYPYRDFAIRFGLVWNFFM